MSASARTAVLSTSARPRHSRSVAAIAALLLGCAIALAAPALSTAQAEETPATSAPQTTADETATESTPAASTPTATEEPNPSATTGPAPAPQISQPKNGQFVGSNRTTVLGSKAASQEIQLLSPRGGDPLCIVNDTSTSWSCDNVYLQNGPNITLRVVVTGSPTLSAEISVAVLGAPTVLGGLTGSESNGWVRGTGHPQAVVTATLPNGDTCNSTADSSGAWACLFSGLGNGSLNVTASQTSSFSEPSSSNSSTPVAIVFDVTAPNAPVVTSPSAGAQVSVAGAQYTGTGETGATVTVFAGAYSVCSAPVIGGTWTCSAGGVAAGSYSVIAVQKDNAGNVGPGSTPASVSYVAESTPTPSGSASATPPVTPTPSPSASPSPDGAVAAPGPTAEPSPTPGPGTTAPDPQAAEPENEGAAASAFPGQWNDPTRFAAAIGPTGTGSPFPWLQAGLLALGALLLIAVPLRLLAGTISRSRGGRPLRALPSLAGRNRVREEYEVAPTVRLNRWLPGGAALLAAATFVMLSGPIVDQPAYLRLLVAVIIGLVLVNAVAILVPLWWSSRVLRLRGTITFLPRYLLLIAAAAIASRLFDIHPALLFGLLGSITLTAATDAVSPHGAHPAAAEPTTAQRGQLAAVRVGALAAFAVLAWSLGSLLPAASDFVTSLAAETGNTIVLAAIGSAVLILVPVGHTSGRRILSWSPLVWTGLTVVTYGILFAALSPMVDQVQSAGTGLTLWITAATFAAVCASAWAWQRFVTPAQR
ncbi:hypothetical protein E3T35_17425 [Cryobacterium sp. TMT1-2-2]|uniref:hypothetical protein n=1 Tax=Cryobacterium sp. TMT1-2-2 TaxID=1259233 RepID=UPI00106BDCD6|nr:hypothetical protein [Cryobacterium sp. TMT1-2-2]TFD08449.1 hypothetical protein E3T35_17425 [Cryobacterium sp. TMT1-2-2]